MTTRFGPQENVTCCPQRGYELCSIGVASREFVDRQALEAQELPIVRQHPPTSPRVRPVFGGLGLTFVEDDGGIDIVDRLGLAQRFAESLSLPEATHVGQGLNVGTGLVHRADQ